MQNSIRAAGAAALLVAVVAANPAHARVLCDTAGPHNKFSSTTVMDKYVVQNNDFNAQVSNNNQCITVDANAPGFIITKETGDAPYTGSNAGGPLGYPSIYIGCHYTNCSPVNSTLTYNNCLPTPTSALPSGVSTTATVSPWQLKSIKSAKSCVAYDVNVDDCASINDQDPSCAIYDASYDIWLDRTARTDGVSDVEIMIWLKYSKGPNPIGKKVATTTIHGLQWLVYAGNNTMNDVISYVAMAQIDSLRFDVLKFKNDAIEREKNNPDPIKTKDKPGPFTITEDWYLTSIQAGFEPWKCNACNPKKDDKDDKVGLAVKKFEAIVEANK